jgi:hypothetical protein
MSAHCQATQPVAAPRTGISPLDVAYIDFTIAVAAARPRLLRLENSPRALMGRIADIDAIETACRDYLKALAEDTAQHMHCSQRPDDIVEAAMSDMAGDLRGVLLEGLEDVAWK